MMILCLSVAFIMMSFFFSKSILGAADHEVDKEKRKMGKKKKKKACHVEQKQSIIKELLDFLTLSRENKNGKRDMYTSNKQFSLAKYVEGSLLSI